jgi:hypothetical protein
MPTLKEALDGVEQSILDEIEELKTKLREQRKERKKLEDIVDVNTPLIRYYKCREMTYSGKPKGKDKFKSTGYLIKWHNIEFVLDNEHIECLNCSKRLTRKKTGALACTISLIFQKDEETYRRVAEYLSLPEWQYDVNDLEDLR